MTKIKKITIDYDNGKLIINGEEVKGRAVIGIEDESTEGWVRQKLINEDQDHNGSTKVSVYCEETRSNTLSRNKQRAKEREERIRKVFSNRMHGYATPLEDVQEIIDVIEILTNRNISIKRAQAILHDAASVLELITIV